MASRRGMNIRIDAAQHRIDTALATLAGDARFAIPERPDQTRDANLNAALQAEWTADVLEAIAAQPGASAPKRTTKKASAS